jgi:hypothetical protein
MRNGILGSLLLVLFGAGAASAQYAPYGYGQPPAAGYPPVAYPYPNGMMPVSYSYPQQGMVLAYPNSADEELQAPNQPMYFSDPSKSAQNTETVPAGFLHRKHAHNGGHSGKPGIKDRILAKTYLPPQPRGVIQSQINGTPPPMRVVAKDYLEGPPNQPRLHDNRTSCPDDCPPDDCGFNDSGLDFIPYTPPGYCMYGNMEYLYWWISRGDIPALLATDPLGTPGVQILVDSLDDLNSGQRHGGRFTVGFWVEPSQRQSVETTYLILGNSLDSLPLGPFRANAVRPFIDATTGQESGSFLADPAGGTVGTFELRQATQLWSWELNLRNEVCRDHWYHFDWTFGGRVLGFEDSLEIRDAIRQEEAGFSALGSVSRVDNFQATNLVYGAQIGMLLELHRKRWFMNIWNKTTIGVNHQEVNIHGGTLSINAFGDQTVFQSGLLALETNSGIHRRNRFAVMPEVGLNAGAQITEHLRISGGYTALFLNTVVRPGDQIDRTVNPTGIAAFEGGGAPNLQGAARPRFMAQDTDFWAHGINASVELRY